MKVTVEEARKEALKRMKKLNFHPNVLSDFKEDIINKSELIGILYWLNDEEIKAVREVDGNTIRKSKITLLSGKNVSSEAKHDYTGADDIEFDGLKAEAERCKNLNGETFWYWLDTPWERSPHVDSSTDFTVVGSGGWLGTYFYMTFFGGVVPCFSVARKPKANC